MRPLGRRAVDLAVLLFGITTLLFFLLRLTGDPAMIIAGEEADIAHVEYIRTYYGFDRPLLQQYAIYMGRLLTLDFGASLASRQPALEMVLDRLGTTLLLTLLALVINTAVSVPIGAWLGVRPDTAARKAGAASVFVAQGVPGFIVGLLLIQLFAVELRWLPSIGSHGIESWILPSLTLASFLAPKVIRVLAANVSEAMREDYIRTARANGASNTEILWRHALPNALLGAAALVGTQVAFLLSGALITEVLFAWPGFGRLLITSVQTLDFPVIQAAVFMIAVLVFLANAATDMMFQIIDPRLRTQRA